MMELVRKIFEMQGISDRLRREGKRIGFVPTMGYLHEGHISLVRKAKELSDSVVVSIFVNPTQFGPGEDYERYPRNEERDRALLEAAGADFLFTPEVVDMYPSGYETFVEVTRVSKGLCGDFRPWHFRGVTTIVAKLFNMVKPHIAVFGEKDYQQLLVIKRMVENLNFDIEIIPGVTVREEDGIAMSSRNAYLSATERGKATILNQSLKKGIHLFESGERKVSAILKAVQENIESAEGIKVQYVEIRDAETLGKIEEIRSPSVIALAAIVGPVRLIDNMVIRVKK